MQGAAGIVFIDRDGVINADPGEKCYVTSWRDFEFLQGALEGIYKLTVAGFKIAVISNQSGVGKGIMTEKDLNEITAKMLKEIERHQGRIDSVQYCMHNDEDNCDCRKPKTGLFEKALKEISQGSELMAHGKISTPQPRAHNPELYFIGDSERDIIAGRNFGCKTVLVLSGKTKKAADVDNWQVLPDYIAKDMYESVDYICGCGHRP